MKIAFIGTGLMGRPMAEQLIKHHHSVIAYNRTREKALPLKDMGAEIAESPGEAVEASQCTILMLSDAGAIHNVLFGQPEGIDFRNKTIIQMGTILPAESREIMSRIEGKGGRYLEAPVLGSTPQARDAQLIVMVGSTPEQFEEWRTLLKCFGPEPFYMGEVGKAAATKLALNQLIVSLSSAFSLSLGIVLREGIDVEQFMKILRKSAFYAPTFDKKLPLMLHRDFSNPHFPTKHMSKDVNLIIEEAKHLGLETAVIEAVRSVVEKALRSGFSETDYSSIYNVINPAT